MLQHLIGATGGAPQRHASRGFLGDDIAHVFHQRGIAFAALLHVVANFPGGGVGQRRVVIDFGDAVGNQLLKLLIRQTGAAVNHQRDA